MRTTLTIDDDILSVAKHLAERGHATIGEVISELARRGLERPPGSDRERNGVLLLPHRQAVPPVTPELVNQLRDELP